MSEDLEGVLRGDGFRVGIVVSRFNEKITTSLIQGAKDKLRRLGVSEKEIFTVKVPGSYELPRGVMQLADKKELDGIVALGAVVRGETPHFEYVSNEASKGIAKLNLELPIPISFGLITADTMDQALNRSGGKQGNKGVEAAEALIEMINLEKEMEG